jgi:hypothetical protein
MKQQIKLSLIKLQIICILAPAVTQGNFQFRSLTTYTRLSAYKHKLAEFLLCISNSIQLCTVHQSKIAIYQIDFDMQLKAI